jgi:signal transduction histidine kinase
VRGLDRTARTPLVTRLLAAITAVLAISFVVTFLFETDRTRAELRRQAQELLDQRAELAMAALADDILAVQREQAVLSTHHPRTPDHQPLQRGDWLQLITDLNEVRRSRPDFTLIAAYTRDGDVIASGTGLGLVAGPPRAMFDAEAASPTARVVPTRDGGLAYVTTQRIPAGRGGEPVLLVFGYRFDDWYASDLRDSSGGSDIVLVADGKAVATSLSEQVDLDELRPEGRERSGIPIVDVADTRYWGEYRTITESDPVWGQDATLGVLIPEPLRRLDAVLLRNRLAAGAALLVIATVLAWIVSRRMTRPLRQLTTTASRITHGDLDAPFVVGSEDEVGVLAGALEDMRRGLQHQLRLIQQQAGALRDGAGRLVNAQDEARRRLAGELHDGVQRQLVMLRLHIGFARERIRQDPDQADEVLDDLAGEIDGVLSRLRETAQGIYPSILRDRGLQGALFSLGSRSQLPLELEVDPDPLPRLPHDLEANAYFLASEAVTNAVKHADATRVRIVVRVRDHRVELVVDDDGGGFDPEAPHRGGGLGNMHDRARALGGEMRIGSDESGTTVTAVLPVDGSVAGPLQEEQDGRDPAVEVELLTQAELLEDRVDVLLDRSFRDREVASDPAVALPGRHQREDVELPRRQPRQP